MSKVSIARVDEVPIHSYVSENSPHLLYEPKVLADLKIGCMKSSPRKVFQIQNLNSRTEIIRSLKNE